MSPSLCRMPMSDVSPSLCRMPMSDVSPSLCRIPTPDVCQMHAKHVPDVCQIYVQCVSDVSGVRQMCLNPAVETHLSKILHRPDRWPTRVRLVSRCQMLVSDPQSTMGEGAADTIDCMSDARQMHGRCILDRNRTLCTETTTRVLSSAQIPAHCSLVQVWAIMPWPCQAVVRCVPDVCQMPFSSRRGRYGERQCHGRGSSDHRA